MIKLKKLNEKQLLVNDDSKVNNTIIQVGSQIKIVTIYGEEIEGCLDKLDDNIFYMVNSCAEMDYEYVKMINGHILDNEPEPDLSYLDSDPEFLEFLDILKNLEQAHINKEQTK